MSVSNKLVIQKEEKNFIENLKKRENASYTILYKRYGNPLFNLAYRITGNVAESEDILQETFVKTYHSIDQFNGSSKLFTWIYSICLNLCYRHLQSKKYPTFESIEDLITESSGWDYRKDKFSEEEWRHYTEKIKDGCLLALVRCLPFSQRAAFVLHILLKIPISNIATILNKSNGSVRVLIFRGKQKIKNFLCSHCSLFKGGNKCSCMNLVDFSLRNGLIKKIDQKKAAKKSSFHPEIIQQEINELKKMIVLYESLKNENPSPQAIKAIRTAMKNDKKVIFAQKKCNISPSGNQTIKKPGRR